MQQFSSNAKWKCPTCDHWNDQDIAVPELDLSAEKTSEMAVDDMVSISCEHCEHIFEGHVFVGVGCVNFELTDPVQFSFEGDAPFCPSSEHLAQTECRSFGGSASSIGYSLGG